MAMYLSRTLSELSSAQAQFDCEAPLPSAGFSRRLWAVPEQPLCPPWPCGAQNFHFQDGWLSEFSARGYEVATETLFFGTQVRAPPAPGAHPPWRQLLFCSN